MTKKAGAGARHRDRLGLVRELPSQRNGAPDPQGPLFPDKCNFAEFQERHERFFSDTARWLLEERGLEGTEALLAAFLE